MHLYKTLKNFLIDFNYYIDIYDNKIHVFRFIDILKLSEKEIIFQMDGFILTLSGDNFKVIQLEKREILISGEILKMEFKK